MERRSGRREFLKQCALGLAATTAGATGCAGAGAGSDEAPLPDDSGAAPPFPEAWRSASTDQERWRAVRDQFLLEPGYAYFNTGGLGPSPRPVLSAVDEAWRRLELRSETSHGERAGVRARVAALLGCAEDELAFTRNATEAMNLVARGLSLHDGDEVVMTTHEHPGGAMPWFGLREDVGIRIRTVEPGRGGDDTLSRLVAALTPRTRVVMVCHITCTTGLVFPVREIVDLCRERRMVSVIDGAQAMGQIPVDLGALGCDFYVASGHKWLLGPKETGVLYVRDEWLDRWKPSYVGGYSDAVFDLDAGEFRRLRPASASEYGTRNTPLLLGLGAAFGFLSTMGMEVVATRGAELAGRLRDGLTPLKGVEILTPAGAAAAILTFRLPTTGRLPGTGGKAGDWCNLLRIDHGLRLRPVGEAGLNGIRASPHVFNSEDEVDRLVDVLARLL